MSFKRKEGANMGANMHVSGLKTTTWARHLVIPTKPRSGQHIVQMVISAKRSQQ